MQDGATATPVAEVSKSHQLEEALKETENQTKSLEHQIRNLLEKINGPIPNADPSATETKPSEDFFSAAAHSQQRIFSSLSASGELMRTLNTLFGV